MTDTTLNRFVASGTNAARIAFTPSPGTPASGPDPLYLWYETDTGDLYEWDPTGAAWTLILSPGAIAPSEVLIATSSPTATATVTFNNISTLIPASFTPKHLRVIASAKSTAAATAFGIQIQARFNNDGGANYDQAQTQHIGGSGPADNSAAGQTQLPFGNIADAGANTQGWGEILILNYLSTAAHRVCKIAGGLVNGNTAADMIDMSGGGRWRNAANAIDRVDVLCSTGNFAAPSLIQLYAVA